MEQQLSGHGGSVTRHWHDVSGLFRERHAELVRLALLVVGDRSTAEDVVQDVFARLYARDLLPRGGDSVSYVRAAVLNRCRSALRRRAVARRFGSARDLGPPDVAHGSAEDEAILAEDRRQVLAALAKLPVWRREVLVLRYWLGLSEAEIAAALGISPGTVKSMPREGSLRSLANLGRSHDQDRRTADRCSQRGCPHGSRGRAPAAARH